jgi:hypothetical protein
MARQKIFPILLSFDALLLRKNAYFDNFAAQITGFSLNNRSDRNRIALKI